MRGAGSALANRRGECMSWLPMCSGGDKRQQRIFSLHRLISWYIIVPCVLYLRRCKCENFETGLIEKKAMSKTMS